MRSSASSALCRVPDYVECVVRGRVLVVVLLALQCA